jgi:hypothetical protein
MSFLSPFAALICRLVGHKCTDAGISYQRCLRCTAPCPEARR